MITNTRDYVKLLCKLKISPEQFLICMLIHDKDSAGMIQYFNENKKHQFKHEQVDELLEREFLVRLSTDSDNYNLDHFAITGKFSGEFLIDGEDAGEEFWNAYPSWLKVKNQKVSAKSCDKDDLIEKYAKKIKGNRKKHARVMLVIEEYVKRNDGYALMGIEKFVGSEQWTILEVEYEEAPNTDLNYSM